MIEPRVTRISKVQNGSLKAFADLTINESLLIKGVRVVEGKHGVFVCMPQQKGSDDRFYDIVKCMNNGVKEHISDVVLYAYQHAE